jgi:hypothetical protein
VAAKKIYVPVVGNIVHVGSQEEGFSGRSRPLRIEVQEIFRYRLEKEEVKRLPE